jgi:hypothetical protein
VANAIGEGSRNLLAALSVVLCANMAQTTALGTACTFNLRG